MQVYNLDPPGALIQKMPAPTPFGLQSKFFKEGYMGDDIAGLLRGILGVKTLNPKPYIRAWERARS